MTRKTFRPVAARIVDMVEIALMEDGGAHAGWYANARALAETLAARYAYSVETVAGVIAALSPMRGWDENVRLASDTLALGKGHGAFRDAVAKVDAMLAGADPLTVLGGLKVRAFYACILSGGDTDAVCVDRHAIDVAMGIRHRDAARPALTSKRYADAAHAYRVATARVNAMHGTGFTPAEIQAMTWGTWRTLHGVQGA